VTVSRFLAPTSAEEAVAHLGDHGSDLVVLGGGTIVMGLITEGKLFPRAAMSLARAGLTGVSRTNGSVEIGATTPIGKLRNLDGSTALAEAAASIGGPALQTMATIGGNLFAPSPAGDLGVALLALDAEIELADAGGPRWLPVETFFAERGTPSFTPAQILTRIRVPPVAGQSHYRKLGRRKANTPSVVAVAVRLDLDGDRTCRDARIALGAAGPAPFRAKQAEQILVGQRLDENLLAEAAHQAMSASDPATDALASAWYRKRMVGVMVKRALTAVAA
jgi:CO/xanthine dehydrogenase FAD-binding subunit